MAEQALEDKDHSSAVGTDEWIQVKEIQGEPFPVSATCI